MENKFNFPQFKEAKYKMNPATGYFEKQPEKIMFNKLPYELKVEPTMEEKIRSQGAKEIIRGRVKNGKYQFFTGLIPVNGNESFEGNHYEFINGKKILSLAVFKFTNDSTELTVYFFNHWYKQNREERVRFVQNFLTN